MSYIDRAGFCLALIGLLLGMAMLNSPAFAQNDPTGEWTPPIPEGFEKDESADSLGTKLHLPPWFEDRRKEILATLEPIVAPSVAASRT